MANDQKTQSAQFTPDKQGGKLAAQLIWEDDHAKFDAIVDPRTAEFAEAMIDQCVELLDSSPGLIKRMVDHAAAGAEDLAVAQFQGIIEVIQNADDVRAKEVRIALRETSAGKQLLLVHNGEPVTCQNVLGMALPYLTTKTERLDQRGRFGIGMKTLKRIASSIAIHSAPYHFSGDQMRMERIKPEASLPGFYDPATDTMLVADLKNDFEEAQLIKWFDGWRDDGLLFLASVSSLRLCSLDGTTLKEKSMSFSQWKDVDFSVESASIENLKMRTVTGYGGPWTVWSATVKVPDGLHPAHKVRSDTTIVSVAVSAKRARPSLFIGFRTAVPTTLPISLDAQFDPNTSREGIIENAWNSWLVGQSADVLAEVAKGLLTTQPREAWTLVPLPDELIGESSEQWPGNRFAEAFGQARLSLARTAQVRCGGATNSISEMVYEAAILEELMSEDDVRLVMPDLVVLTQKERDAAGRWRRVLESLAVSREIGTPELLDALEEGQFASKMPEWWVDAGAKIVEFHPHYDIFGRKFLINEGGDASVCFAEGETEELLLSGANTTPFGERWNLFERLHPAYRKSKSGDEVLEWLRNFAAFAEELDAQVELAAFAEKYEQEPIEISDDELRDLRSRFDELTDREVGKVGLAVGQALLLDGYTFKSSKQAKLKVSPATAYLCKTLDGENSTWPNAVEKSEGYNWIAARYDTVLKTGAKRWSKRKSDAGIVSRGPRRFLLLLGAEVAPRIEESAGPVRGGEGRRWRELRARGAEKVKFDYTSPDLSRALRSLATTKGRVAKKRSSALMRTLSRNWERLYAGKTTVTAQHLARVYTYDRGFVTAAWLNELRDTEWVAVTRGKPVLPSQAVIRSPDTQAVYDRFAYDLASVDVIDGLASALDLITDVRIQDLIGRLEELRDQKPATTSAQTQDIYRTIAKRCPRRANYSSRVGEMTVQNLRSKFLDGDGLIHLGGDKWRRPNELLSGPDIFHGRRDFVPSGASCDRLWQTLEIPKPDLDACAEFAAELADEPYGTEVEAALIDVYRHMEALIQKSGRTQSGRLRRLPLYCVTGWVDERPCLYVENEELRLQLASRVKSRNFWHPPCDILEIKKLADLMGVEVVDLDLEVVKDSSDNFERGEQIRSQFENAINHLSRELAHNDTELRARISIGWEQLKAIPIGLHVGPIEVRARGAWFPKSGVLVDLRALKTQGSISFHFQEDFVGDREAGGQVIATLFPRAYRRRIDAEWVLAWQKGLQEQASSFQLATDDARKRAMEETAQAINSGKPKKIRVSRPKSGTAAPPPRTLKPSVGRISGAKIDEGRQPRKTISPKPKKGALKSNPPKQPKDKGNPSAPTAYTAQDVEQRAWEILVQALETSEDKRLVDFRKSRGVGADGAIDWTKFVELKATARGRQSQVDLTTAEFERAKQEGSNFILALVSGLETGFKDEVRLIFDPVNSATVRPTNGVRLVNLADAPSVTIDFEGEGDEQ